jgi:hypothetical protein
MYGPCFDGKPSLPMACIQHPALFPTEMLGSYYYPPQRVEAALPGGATGDFLRQAEHMYLGADLAPFSTNSGPSWYGIGLDRSVRYPISPLHRNWGSVLTHLL